MFREESETIVSRLQQIHMEHPSKVAIKYIYNSKGEFDQVDYGSLWVLVSHLARKIEGQTSIGERAILPVTSGLSFVVAFLACLVRGVVAVAVPYRRRPEREQNRADSTYGHIIDNSNATCVICESGTPLPRDVSSLKFICSDLPEDLLSNPAPIAVKVGLDDPAYLQYTSGSTTNPKGVLVRHRNIVANVTALESAMATSEDTIAVSWLPLYHDMGMVGTLLHPLWLGAEAVLMNPLAAVQNPLRWLEAISVHRGTFSGAPNFAYDLCAKKIERLTDESIQHIDLSSWKVAFNGAEPVRAATLRRARHVLGRLGLASSSMLPCYGLAEATLFVAGKPAQAPPTIIRVDRASFERGDVIEVERGSDGFEVVSCGVCQQRHHVQIVDPNDHSPLPEGKVGEIWVQGPSVVSNYWADDQSSELKLRQKLVGIAGEFLRSGDLGFLHEGHLFVCGRLKDVIVVNGRNIYPADIEAIADELMLDGTTKSACFSVGKGGLEEIVVLCEGRWKRESDVDSIIQKVRGEVVKSVGIAPRIVACVPPGTIPMTSSGKVRRALLKSRFCEGELQVEQYYV